MEVLGFSVFSIGNNTIFVLAVGQSKSRWRMSKHVLFQNFLLALYSLTGFYHPKVEGAFPSASHFKKWIFKIQL